MRSPWPAAAIEGIGAGEQKDSINGKTRRSALPGAAAARRPPSASHSFNSSSFFSRDRPFQTDRRTCCRYRDRRGVRVRYFRPHEHLFPYQRHQWPRLGVDQQCLLGSREINGRAGSSFSDWCRVCAARSPRTNNHIGVEQGNVLHPAANVSLHFYNPDNRNLRDKQKLVRGAVVGDNSAICLASTFAATIANVWSRH